MTSTTNTGSLASSNAVLSTLANETRRDVLHVLVHSDEEVLPFDALVARIVERERADDEEPGVEYRQRLRTELHHVHLPKLDEHGMITYDADANRIQNIFAGPWQELLTAVESYERRA